MVRTVQGESGTPSNHTTYHQRLKYTSEGRGHRVYREEEVLQMLWETGLPSDTERDRRRRQRTLWIEADAPRRLAEDARHVLREDRLAPEAPLRPRPHRGCDAPLRDGGGRSLWPRYEQLKEELGREASIHGDETSWRIKGRNHWLWAFLGRWSVVYEVDRSRGKDVPRKVLGDYRGTVISDSWGAWNHIGVRWQRCLVHYLRELEDTIKYKSPGKSFLPFRKKLRRILRDAIGTADEKDHGERLRAKARLETRIDELISSYSPTKERNCARLLKRLRRERGMLFTFLEEDGVDWNNNAAERALRSSVVIRKITYGSQSDEGAHAHAVLMSIKETCALRKENFFDYAMGYLSKQTSER